MSLMYICPSVCTLSPQQAVRSHIPVNATSPRLAYVAHAPGGWHRLQFIGPRLVTWNPRASIWSSSVAYANGANGTFAFSEGERREERAVEGARLENKRRTAWNKGKTVPEAVKEKISECMRRKWQDPEYKSAVSAALKGKEPWNKGRTLSDETREKMRLAKLSHTVSRSTRQKMSAARRGKCLAPEAAAAVSAALRGRPKSEEHKAAIAAAQRRRHAAARVLRAVESVYNEAEVVQESVSENGSNSNILQRTSRGILSQELRTRRQAKSQVLNAFKAELREYRSLQEELSPWTQAFLERHDRKPTMIDVQRTGIEWLISRYKQYVLLRDRLFNETSLLRSRLNGAIPDPSSLEIAARRDNAAAPPRDFLGGNGPTNANGPSVASRAAVASRVQVAFQYRKQKNSRKEEASATSNSCEVGSEDPSELLNEGYAAAVSSSSVDTCSEDADGRLDALARGVASSTRMTPRVRSAMNAAMEYRKKRAQATRAAALAAANAVKFGSKKANNRNVHNPSSKGSNDQADPVLETVSLGSKTGIGERKEVGKTESVDSLAERVENVQNLPPDVCFTQTAAGHAHDDMYHAEERVKRILQIETDAAGQHDVHCENEKVVVASAS